MRPLVSIMIATYNQPDYIKQCVESCLNQDYENIEVVVGDDSTNEDNYEALKPLFKNEKLKYFRNETNLGRVKNYKNLLFELATGEWAVMMDGDDYYSDLSFISKAVDIIDQDAEVVLVAAGHSLLQESKNINTPLPLIDETKVFDGKEVFYKNLNIGQHSTDIYKRQKAIDLDFYRMDSMGTDSEGLFRLCLHGKVAYLKDIVVCWRIHETNNTFLPGDAIKQMREMVFIDSIYQYALNYIDKESADKWRKNFYTAMSYHIMHLAEQSGKPVNVLYVLKWAAKFWGVRPTLSYIKRNFLTGSVSIKTSKKQ